MTTVPSIAFPTMEVPTADDTMEMASPLPGHADDFDIDLDVMEDQTSNVDKDMMGADDYPDESIEIEYTRDGANDADMMDDVAEPAMVDADNQYPETNDNVEMQYSADETYEAEMLEDDYDEDIDVPIAKSDEQGPATAQNDIGQKPEFEIEPPQTNDVIKGESEKPALETHVEPTEEHVTEPAEAPRTEQEQRDHPESEHVQEAELQPDSSDPLDDKLPETNQTERDVVQSAQTDLDKDGPTDSKQSEEGASETTEAQPPLDQPKEQEVEATAVQDTEKPKEKEQGADMNGHVALHPVKVYYQDNEVSLFPPREGDLSETFFLEDESLAYENFGKLFESFREVLREHIGENDVLVVDIDALNIQLTEDSLHSSEVTLRQIINVYLHLCDNESIGEPESLCITLSTKLTASAAISELAAAANEGKGLSEIFSWDEYDEVEPLSAGPDAEPDAEPQHGPEFQHQAPEESQESRRSQEHEEHEELAEHVADPEAAEEQEKAEASDEQQINEAAEVTQVPEQDAAEHEKAHNHEIQPELTNEAEPAVHEGAHVEQEDREQEDDKLAPSQPGEEFEDAALPEKGEDDEYGEIDEGEYEEDVQEYHDSELEYQDHPSNNRSYDSEEQKTESTATIAPLPATDSQQDV